MIWDILTWRRKGERKGEKDEFDFVIERIERFAPKKYVSERRMFYYNYKMLPLYGKPLMHLLDVISRGGEKGAHLEALTRELFYGLKGFYDPKDRLPLSAAMGDNELMRRYADLFVIFFGMGKPSREDVRGWLLDVD
jgi:hypothetical protein